VKVETLFSEVVHYESIDADVDLLAKQALKYAEENDGRIASNRGGWQSGYNPRISPEYDELIFQIEDLGNKVAKEYQLQKPLQLANCWLNINDQYDYNLAHSHGTCFLSGCFYIKTNELIETDQEGRIRFERMDARYMWMTHNMEHFLIDNTYEFYPNPLNVEHRSIVPQESTAYFWPSWMFHGVEPHKDENPRITLAYNLIV